MDLRSKSMPSRKVLEQHLGHAEQKMKRLLNLEIDESECESKLKAHGVSLKSNYREYHKISSQLTKLLVDQGCKSVAKSVIDEKDMLKDELEVAIKLINAQIKEQEPISEVGSQFSHSSLASIRNVDQNPEQILEDLPIDETADRLQRLFTNPNVNDDVSATGAAQDEPQRTAPSPMIQDNVNFKEFIPISHVPKVHFNDNNVSNAQSLINFDSQNAINAVVSDSNTQIRYSQAKNVQSMSDNAINHPNVNPYNAHSMVGNASQSNVMFYPPANNSLQCLSSNPFPHYSMLPPNVSSMSIPPPIPDPPKPPFSFPPIKPAPVFSYPSQFQQTPPFGQNHYYVSAPTHNAPKTNLLFQNVNPANCTANVTPGALNQPIYSSGHPMTAHESKIFPQCTTNDNSNCRVDPASLHLLKQELLKKPSNPYDGDPQFFQKFKNQMNSRLKGLPLDSWDLICILEAQTTGKPQEIIQSHITNASVNPDQALQDIQAKHHSLVHGVYLVEIIHLLYIGTTK